MWFGMEMALQCRSMNQWIGHRCRDQPEEFRSRWSIELCLVHMEYSFGLILHSNSNWCMGLVHSQCRSPELVDRMSRVQLLVLRSMMSIQLGWVHKERSFELILGKRSSFHMGMAHIQWCMMTLNLRLLMQLQFLLMENKSMRSWCRDQQWVLRRSQSISLGLVRTQRSFQLALHNSSIRYMEMVRMILDMIQLIHHMSKDQLMARSSNLTMRLVWVGIQHSFELMVGRCNRWHMEKALTHRSMFHSLVHMNRDQRLTLRNSLSTKLVMVRSKQSCLLMASSNNKLKLKLGMVRCQCCSCLLIRHSNKVQLLGFHRNQSRQEELVHKCNSFQLRVHSSSMRDMEMALTLGSMIEWILHTSRVG